MAAPRHGFRRRRCGILVDVSTTDGQGQGGSREGQTARRTRVKTFGQYVLSCLVMIALLGAIAFAFAGPAGRQVVVVSAALALAVQAVAFTVARLLQRQNLMLGWGLGSVLRLVALVLYALVVAKLWR